MAFTSQQMPQPIHAFASLMHMHTIGASISTEVRPSATDRASLGDVPAWDFNAQYWKPIDVAVRPGDTVRTHCAWSNRTDSPVTFGERTEDEMCFGFTMYYPKIVLRASIGPALRSNCTPE
jgi:hypothetical protein